MICDNCGKKFNAWEGVENPFHNFCAKKCEDEFMKRKGDIGRQAARVVFNPELTPMLDKDVEDALQKIFRTKFPACAHDQVKHPSRYNQGGIEFWDVEKAFFGIDSHVDHLVQSALEYGVRFRRKNGAQDLRKAANLLERAADLMERQAPGLRFDHPPKPCEHPGTLANEPRNYTCNLVNEIEKYKESHNSAMPTRILMTGHYYNRILEENERSTRMDEFMGVRVVISKCIENGKELKLI